MVAHPRVAKNVKLQLLVSMALLKLLNNSKAIGKLEGDKLMKTLKHRENRLHPGF